MTSRAGRVSSLVGILELSEKIQSWFHPFILLSAVYIIVIDCFCLLADKLSLSAKGYSSFLLLWLPQNDVACPCISGHHGHEPMLQFFQTNGALILSQYYTGSHTVKLGIL